MKLSKALVMKCLNVIDQGLVCGLGVPEPGKMCVEAAINYALGRPHGDDPGCVAKSVRSLKITLNDRKWPSNKARAKGLRRLAIAQLGTKGTLDETEFAIRCTLLVYRAPDFVAWAERWLSGEDRTRESAEAAAWSASAAAAYAASAASAATAPAHRTVSLAVFAEQVVQILVTMKAPAVKYLSLTE